MKKSMILIIFLKLLLIISSDDDIDVIFKGKCEDKKAKTGACMYYIENYDSKDHDEYALFNKCGKGEKCDDEFNMCIKDFGKKIRKVGESCNYDEDCDSNSCESNKCTALKEGDKCGSGISCDSWLFCNINSNGNPKCTKYAKEGEKADNTECMKGLGRDKDNKCVRYGTVDDKIEIKSSSDHLICKSGYAHTKVDDSSHSYITICDSIDIEPECNEDRTLKKEGKWSDETPIINDCTVNEDYTGAKKYYSENYSKLRSKLYADFIKDFNKLDLDKVDSDGLKWKIQKKRLLYQYATHLKAAGLIDSEGKVVKDKKCEYEFIMKNSLHSNYIKLNTIIIAMIALLLF